MHHYCEIYLTADVTLSLHGGMEIGFSNRSNQFQQAQQSENNLQITEFSIGRKLKFQHVGI